MYVIYAEKPDVGNKIAAALGGFDLPDGTRIDFKNRADYEAEIKKFQNQQGYLDITFRGKPAKVTWGRGHLYSLQDVHEYEPAYEKWHKRPTCFIPDEFVLHPTSSSIPAFHHAMEKQRSVVKTLLLKADHVISATDDDREGELIFAYVCEAIGFHKPFERVHFATQTEKGIQDAFDHLIPSSAIQNTVYAGRARAIYDWVIGTNLSTRMTLRFPGNGVLSIGRVQTPVLKMVVDREEAIRSFIPKISWNIKGTFSVGKESYNGLCRGTGDWTKTDADNILKAIRGKNGIVTKLEKKKEKREVPLLYSQTSLVIDASKYFGYTAKEVLTATQWLYDNGYTSYPRTKSQHLTDDMYSDTVAILKELAKTSAYGRFFTGRKIEPAKRFFNSSKVKSHFAIIPTGDEPKKLTPVNQNIYDLIVWSLIRTIYPDAILEKTSVTTTVDGKYDFASSGSTVVNAGWLAVNGMTKETMLPAIVDGASYPGVYEGKETKTEPPRRYDDGSLMKAMKTAGKDLDDAAFRAILADPDVEGIGTDATRAEIIETLIRRDYMVRKGKVFEPTQKGIDLIHTVPVPDMMSAEFTARMEQNLSNIENGTLAYNDFLEQIFVQTKTWCETIASCSGGALKAAAPTIVHTPHKVTTSAFCAAPLDEEDEVPTPEPTVRNKAAHKSEAKSAMTCPLCGASITVDEKGYRCSSRGCDVYIPKMMLSHKITATEAKALLKKKDTKKIDDFVSKKTGKKFSAKLRYTPEVNKLEFIFGE